MTNWVFRFAHPCAKGASTNSGPPTFGLLPIACLESSEADEQAERALSSHCLRGSAISKLSLDVESVDNRQSSNSRKRLILTVWQSRPSMTATWQIKATFYIRVFLTGLCTE